MLKACARVLRAGVTGSSRGALGTVLFESLGEPSDPTSEVIEEGRGEGPGLWRGTAEGRSRASQGAAFRASQGAACFEDVQRC